MNRFKCLEEDTPENDDNLGESGRKSPLIGSGRIRSRGEKSSQTSTTSSHMSNKQSSENTKLIDIHVLESTSSGMMMMCVRCVVS